MKIFTVLMLVASLPCALCTYFGEFFINFLSFDAMDAGSLQCAACTQFGELVNTALEQLVAILETY